jgi:multidrug efflux pump subunit AcrA (membrane-fusion protein)
LIHRGFIGVGYDDGQRVRDEEQIVGRKEPNRKQGEETEQSRWGFRGKTVWDWMALLIVPLVLVVIGLVFTLLQDARQQEIEDRRAQDAQKIENQRAEAERELAEQRAQDEALQAYLDQMSQLMLERKLLEAEPGDPVHTLAQARTSTVILRLDAEHNESVARFLIDSGLALRSKASAKLLEDIVLSHATLSDASLFFADLSDANLFIADLVGADLSDANLEGARATEEQLEQAKSLEGATMPNGQKYEDWLNDREKRQQDE